jgi:leucyl-tRNA synthetase
MLGKSGMLKDKRVMPFVSLLKRKVQDQGVSAFERQLPFNELETLDENIHYLRRELAMLKVKEVQIIDVASEAGAHKLDVTVPGLPSYDLVELA